MTLTEMTTGMLRSDEAAYLVFHREYQRRVFHYVLKLVGGQEEDALDVSQDVLLRVIRHIRVFDDEDQFWNWLTRLARSAAVDHGRRSTSWWQRIQRIWSPLAVSVDQDSEELLPLVQQAIGTLPPEDRDLIEARYTGTSVRDLAQSLGLSEEAIESRLVRIRARIREQVQRWRRHDAE